MSAAVSAFTERLRAGTRSEHWPWLVIFIGFAVGSFGPLFIRAVLVAGMPSVAIVAGRQLIASVLLTPLVLRHHRHELRHLSRRNLFFATLAGIVLAVRFYFQFEAFNNTSVLLTGVFGGSGPLWVALIEVSLLRALFNRKVWAGMLLAVAGGVIIALAGFDGGTSPGNNALLGAVYALTAALLSAFYLNFGRLARGQISFWPYLWLIFCIAAVVSVIVALLAGVPLTGYSNEAWLTLIALTITAQLFGHGSMNYSLGHLPATYISVFAQATIVFSAVGAFFLFGEQPGPAQLLGSLVIILGVTLVTLGRQRQKAD